VPDNVVVGLPLLTDPYDPQASRLGDPPAGLPARAGACGVVQAPPTTDGVYRTQRARVTVGPATYPALEIAAARQRLDPARLPAGDYHIAFPGGPGSLPHVPLDAVLSGGLVRELVEGRTVLVGRAPDPSAPGLFTPTTGRGPGLSALEYQGQALDSLLGRRTVATLGPAERLLLLLLTGTACATVYQRLEATTAFWVSLPVLAAGGLVAAGLLAAAHVWLPVADLSAAQVLCLFFTFRGKAARSYRQARRLLLELVSGVKAETLPAGFPEAPDPWALLVRLVTQHLDVERLVFLEAAGDRRLRPAAAFPGPPATADPGRCDAGAEPFRGALAAGGPVPLAAPPPVFPPREVPERQYLAPLVFAGQLLGFWALAVDPARAQAVSRFEAVLGELAQQMAELLYRRQQLAADRADRPRLLALVTEEEEHADLAWAVAVLERRLTRKERLFADSATPVVSFDLFGRVREANTAMLELLAAEGLAATELTAVDLVAALTGAGPELARRGLRHVTLDRGRLALPVRSTRRPGDYLLSLSPLREPDAAEDGAPARPGGVCCEVLDRTTVAQLAKVKEQLTGELAVLLRNDLAAVDLSAGLLADASLGPAERAEVAGIVSDKVRRVLDTLATCQQYLAVDVPGEGDRIPVDPRPLLARARQAVEPLLRAQAVTVEVRAPDLLSYVLASPDHLRRVFEDVLTLLIRDAGRGTMLTVGVREEGEAVVYAFANSGCGLSDERFRDYLFGDGPVTSEEFRRLREGVRWVAGWGGRVEAGSWVGEGTAVTLSLPRFR
jgi:signal transduction histidine kinase